MNLADFLLARIRDDEANARALVYPDKELRTVDERGLEWVNPSDTWQDTWRFAIPVARMLDECDAKRQIITEFWDRHSENGLGQGAAEFLLQLLALPFAGHPDYQDEWRP